MTGFERCTGRFVPLDIANVDTDAIIPKQFLQKVTRAGFGQHLFHDWRFVEGDTARPNPDFVLNRPEYRHAPILLTRSNFGCGSSREHAPWALTDYGLRVIIAPSFADIFYNNAFNSALLPVRLPEEVVEILFQIAGCDPTQEMTVDLHRQTVTVVGGDSYPFELDPFHRRCLLHGLDTIGLTLEQDADITRYEASRPRYLRQTQAG